MIKSKGGRPLKLTNDVRDAIISCIRQGLTLKAACRCAGISYSTFANWRQKNRKLLKQEPPTELYQFVAAIDVEMSHMRHEHRLAAVASIKPRDYRFGWKNPMRDETKQNLRVKAFEKAVENVLRSRRYL